MVKLSPIQIPIAASHLVNGGRNLAFYCEAVRISYGKYPWGVSAKLGSLGCPPR